MLRFQLLVKEALLTLLYYILHKVYTVACSYRWLKFEYLLDRVIYNGLYFKFQSSKLEMAKALRHDFEVIQAVDKHNTFKTICVHVDCLLQAQKGLVALTFAA